MSQSKIEAHIDVASVKIDFKIDQDGIVRIIDLSDGFSADVAGFEKQFVVSKMLSYMHEATKAPIVPIFGELPYEAVCPESKNIPIILREPKKIGQSWLEASDLMSQHERFIPYSEMRRIQSYISYAWGKQTDKAIVAPIGLKAMEMHKALWYFLLEQEMSAEDKPKVLYWNNDTIPGRVNTRELNAKFGFFIKIADRSECCGGEVYYAKDNEQLQEILIRLHKNYKSSVEAYKKHLFVIEPAYMTIKQSKGIDYNATGRAFLTLIYDKTTNTLNTKIAAAKWLFPLKPLQNNNLSQDQMLSNVKNSIGMVDLNAQELQVLTSAIEKTYAKAFKSSFTHDDLMLYCSTHPQMQEFKLCLRANTLYPAFLNVSNNSIEQEDNQSYQLLISYVNSLINKDYLKSFMSYIALYENKNLMFFTVPSSLEDISKKICMLSFFENYISELKNLDKEYSTVFTFIPKLVQKEDLVKQILNQHIVKYLSMKNSKYDKNDWNRALRQAVSIGDVSTMKMLLHTHRADAHARSASNKTALDNALSNTNEETKEQCLKILRQAGVSIEQIPQTQLNESMNNSLKG